MRNRSYQLDYLLESNKKRGTAFSEKMAKNTFVTKKHPSGVINYRWTQESEKGRKRSDRIAQACEMYGLEPGPRLIDRLLDDISLIKEERVKKHQKLLELQKELQGSNI